MSNKVDYKARIQRMEKESLISIDELKASSILDYGISANKILPSIITIQQLYLEELLGTALYKKLQEPSLPYEYQTLLENYVYNVLVHLALAEYLNIAGYTVAEGGVFRHGNTNSESVSSTEIARLVQEEKYKAELYKKRMIGFIKDYKEYYPEYSQCADGGIKANDRRLITGGIVLSRTRIPSSSNTCTSCNSAMEGSRCTNHSCPASATMFDLEFWSGNSSESEMAALDLGTLTQETTIPQYIIAEPQSSYYWIVSNRDIVITQIDTPIPMADFITDGVSTEELYVKGEYDGKHYIRIRIEDTYEESVEFGINKA